MDVLILAGGKVDETLRRRIGVEYRAQLPFGKQTMLERVLKAVRKFGNIKVVSTAEVEGLPVIPAGRSFVESLGNGLAQITSETFLLVTADIPFITAEAIDDFLERCDKTALINYPIIPLDAAEAAYPGIKRTSYRLSIGPVTGGNIALVNTAMMRRSLPKLEKAYKNRKNVLKLALLIGPGILGRFVVGAALPKTLTVQSLEQAIGKIMGGRVKAIYTEHAEIGNDIDNIEQYEQAVQMLV
ncbi:MAG: NTP transferase domain-containing protein [Chthonomonas sp.]|nr:NTP transferase domain-containing protein [Chthonomonas sp.]